MLSKVVADDILELIFFFREKKIRLDIACEGLIHVFVCVEVLRPSQPNGVMLSAVSLPDSHEMASLI